MGALRRLGLRISLLCALLAASHSGGGGVAAAAQRLPSWAKKITKPTSKARDAVFDYNVQVVEGANESGGQLDVVMYGDSITANLQDKYAAVWQDWMGAWKSVALGVPGSTVDELVWRIMAGGEQLKVPPKVVIIHIGINNDLAEGPAFKLDFLLTYLAGVYPRTRIIVVTPLPSKKRAYIAYRDAYARVVARHKGVFFSLCGAALDPSSTLNFKDGVHPVAGGYNIIFKCLKPQVTAALWRWQRNTV